MREGFEPIPDLGKQLQAALQQKQGEALLENSTLIKEYQEAEFQEEVESRRNQREGNESKKEILPRESVIDSKLTDSITRMLKAGLLEEVKDHKSYPEFIHDSQIQKVAINFFNTFCQEDKAEAAFDIIQTFDIPSKKCEAGVALLIKRVLLENNRLRDISWQKPLNNNYHDSDDYYDNHDDNDESEAGYRRREEQRKQTDKMIGEYALRDVESILTAIGKFPKEIIESDAVQEVAMETFKERMITIVRNAGDKRFEQADERRIDGMITIFNFDKNTVQSKDVLKSIDEYFQNEVKGSHQNITRLMPGILKLEKYFSGLQRFHSMPNLRRVVAEVIFQYESEGLDGFIPNVKTEEADKYDAELKRLYAISRNGLDAVARKVFKENLKLVMDGQGYRGTQPLEHAHAWLKLPKPQIETEFLSNLDSLKKTLKREDLDWNGNSKLGGSQFLKKTLKTLGIEDVVNLPEVQEVIQSHIVEIVHRLRNDRNAQGNTDVFIDWSKNLFDSYRELLAQSLDGGSIEYYVENFMLTITPEEMVKLKNNREDFESRLVQNIKFYKIAFPDLEENIQYVAAGALSTYLETEITFSGKPISINDKLFKLPELIKSMGVSEAVLSELELRAVAKEHLESFVAQIARPYGVHQLSDSVKIINIYRKFGISQEEIEKMVTDTARINISQHTNYTAESLLALANGFNLGVKTKSTINGLAFKEAMTSGNEKLAIEIKGLGISDDILLEKFEVKEKQYLLAALSRSDLGQIKSLISTSSENLQDTPEVIEAGYKMWSQLISSGQWDQSIELLTYIPLPAEKASSPEARNIIINGFLREIQSWNGGRAVSVYKKYLSDLSVAQISDLLPQTKPFVEVLKSKFQNLYQKYVSSIELFVSIVPSLNERVITILEAHPFLAQALENNSQFSLKLLFKFDSLDKLSKANITELYADKEKVLADRPDIDPNSRDFRIAMQDYLMPYRRNEEILNSMKKFGIETEEWLNHEDEMFFELGDSSNVLVSEQIKLAVDRTSESVDQAIEICRTIIDEYQKELMEGNVPTIDEHELKQQLEEMKSEKEKAEQSGNDKKAQGIAKGIKNIEEQLENPKLVPAWTKFVSELSRLSIVKKDIVRLNEELKAKELEQKELDTSESNPRTRRKEQQKIKGHIEKIKKDIAEKNSLIVDRFQQYPGRVEAILKKVLGDDRASAIVQEINQSQGEILDHLITDNGTIEATVNPKNENDLDDSTMRISVWDRNPDVDLYMGNYTDCCIRIDSDHMGEESTIADYLTDLGIQIVAIYDEKKEIPVAAAWCWVGYDDDDNRALVIDNVEADKGYIKHKKQLEEKMKEYIESYARKSKLGKVVQGKLHNDLVVAPMDSSYYKLGGYNRASGYFLEAENNE